MKKIVFLTIMLALAGGAAAQIPHIVPAGDTLRGRDSTFLYSTWLDTCLIDTIHRDMIWRRGLSTYVPVRLMLPDLNYLDFYRWDFQNSNSIVGRKMYTPTPISIKGVAAIGEWAYLTCHGNGPHPPHGLACDTTMASRLPEYLQLYMPKEGDSVTDSGSVDLNLIDEAEWHLLYPSREVVVVDGAEVGELYEVYFDTARTVNGTFFVAGTQNNSRYVAIYNERGDTTWTGEHMSSPYRIYMAMLAPDYDVCATDSNRTYLTDNWILRPPDSSFFCAFPAKNVVLCMFPIIDTGFVYVPPVCPEVLNLHREETPDPGVLLFWDAHPAQTRWQVAYGSPGMNPDTCSAVVESTRLWCRLTDLRQGEPYAVFARAWCDSTGSWSSWGDSIMVTYGTAGGGTGGDTTAVGPDPSALASFTYLFPNPAAGRVQVASSFGLRSIEVFALDGRRMLSLPASGLTAAFDTAAWPRGTYIILIKTPAGSTTKKLSVISDQ